MQPTVASFAGPRLPPQVTPLPTSHPNTYNEVAAQSLSRIKALSDGVFAIAMTLLVLDL